MATVTYVGRHPEISLTMQLPREAGYVAPQNMRGCGVPIQVFGFPPGVPRRVPRWLAIWLAAVRRHYGPWFVVRLDRGEWQACLAQTLRRPLHPPKRPKGTSRRWWRRQHAITPWLRKATDALVLAPHDILEALRRAETRPYEAFNAVSRGPVIQYDPLGAQAVVVGPEPTGRLDGPDSWAPYRTG